MADISTYLENILSAVYGEEVRGSIHDAIEKINKECEDGLSTAGSYVTQAKGYASDAKSSETNAKAYEEKAKEYAESASASSGFPVGSIFITTSSTNPSSFFPNTTWERIKDAFLFANGDDKSEYFALKSDKDITSNSLKVYMWKRLT